MADTQAIIAPVSVANTPAIIATATALDANPARAGWMIQNTGTNVIYLRFGAGASTTVFHILLKGGSGNNDGLGASYSQMDGIVFTGLVSIAGSSPLYVVTELTK